MLWNLKIIAYSGQKCIKNSFIRFLDQTSLFHEDCITRQKYIISLKYNSDYAFSIPSQACKNQTLSIQICHEVTLLLSNSLIHMLKKCPGLKGHFPILSQLSVQILKAQIDIRVNKTIPTSSTSKAHIYKNDTIHISRNLHK